MRYRKIGQIAVCSIPTCADIGNSIDLMLFWWMDTGDSIDLMDLFWGMGNCKHLRKEVCRKVDLGL